MPGRYTRFARRARGYKNSKIWYPHPINWQTLKADGSAPEVKQNSVYLMDWISPPSDEVEHVIERIRGQFNTVTAGFGSVFPGTIYTWVGPTAMLNDADGNEITAGSEVTHFPDLYDKNGTDDYQLVADACVPTSGATSSGNGVSSAFPIIDTKAKRRVSRDQVLYFLLRTLSALTTSIPGANDSIKILGAMRILLKAIP